MMARKKKLKKGFNKEEKEILHFALVSTQI